MTSVVGTHQEQHRKPSTRYVRAVPSPHVRARKDGASKLLARLLEPAMIEQTFSIQRGRCVRIYASLVSYNNKQHNSADQQGVGRSSNGCTLQAKFDLHNYTYLYTKGDKQVASRSKPSAFG